MNEQSSPDNLRRPEQPDEMTRQPGTALERYYPPPIAQQTTQEAINAQIRDGCVPSVRRGEVSSSAPKLPAPRDREDGSSETKETAGSYAQRLTALLRAVREARRTVKEEISPTEPDRVPPPSFGSSASTTPSATGLSGSPVPTHRPELLPGETTPPPSFGAPTGERVAAHNAAATSNESDDNGKVGRFDDDMIPVRFSEDKESRRPPDANSNQENQPQDSRDSQDPSDSPKAPSGQPDQFAVAVRANAEAGRKTDGDAEPFDEPKGEVTETDIATTEHATGTKEIDMAVEQGRSQTHFAVDMTEYIEDMVTVREALCSPVQTEAAGDDQAVAERGIVETPGNYEGYVDYGQVSTEQPTARALSQLLILQSLGYDIRFTTEAFGDQAWPNHLLALLPLGQQDEIKRILVSDARREGPSIDFLWGLTAEGGVDSLERPAWWQGHMDADPATEQLLVARAFMTSRLFWGAREAWEGRRLPREFMIRSMRPNFWDDEDRFREVYERLHAEGVRPFTIREMYDMGERTIRGTLERLNITPPNERGHEEERP